MVSGILGELSLGIIGHRLLLMVCVRKRQLIADRFADVFQTACVPNSRNRHKSIENKFLSIIRLILVILLMLKGYLWTLFRIVWII